MKLSVKRDLLLRIILVFNFFFIDLASTNFVFSVFSLIGEFRKKDSVRNFFNTFEYFEPLAVFSGIYASVEVGEMALEWFALLKPNNARRKSSHPRNEWFDKRRLTKLSIASLIWLLKQDWNSDPANLIAGAQSTKKDLNDSQKTRASFVSKLSKDEQEFYRSHSNVDLNYINNVKNQYEKIYEDANLNEKEKKSQIENMIYQNPGSEKLIKDIDVMLTNRKNNKQ